MPPRRETTPGEQVPCTCSPGNGWQHVETFRGPQLAARKTYGAGLDEVVREERDLDGDGTMETRIIPIHDSTGSAAMLTSESGRVVELRDHEAFGTSTIFADATPPKIEQITDFGCQPFFLLLKSVV